MGYQDGSRLLEDQDLLVQSVSLEFFGFREFYGRLDGEIDLLEKFLVFYIENLLSLRFCSFILLCFL